MSDMSEDTKVKKVTPMVVEDKEEKETKELRVKSKEELIEMLQRLTRIAVSYEGIIGKNNNTITDLENERNTLRLVCDNYTGEVRHLLESAAYFKTISLTNNQMFQNYIDRTKERELTRINILAPKQKKD